MRVIIFFLLLGLLSSGCVNDKMPFKAEEIKKRLVDTFVDVVDTAEIGVAFLSQDSLHHWAVAYNRIQTQSAIYMYDAEDRTVPPQIIRLRRPNCSIDRVELNDATHDGHFEMLVYLRYDYGLSYQGRELVIFHHPFDTIAANKKEIFAHPIGQMWTKIDTFDADFGTPIHRKTVGTELSAELFEDIILLRGTFEERRNIKREYKWNGDKQMFELISDEQLHEATEEEKRRPQVAARTETGRLLLEVVAHDVGCRSFVIETADGYVVELPQLIHDALLCSPVTALSPDGHFLIFTNRARRTLDAYNFATHETKILVERIGALEGISDVVWFKQKERLFAACIIANPEEYLYNTRVYIFELRGDDRHRTQFYDQEAWYRCESRTSSCVPQVEEDFRFNTKGQFVFRLRKNNKPSLDFGTIDLPL